MTLVNCLCSSVLSNKVDGEPLLRQVLIRDHVASVSSWFRRQFNDTVCSCKNKMKREKVTTDLHTLAVTAAKNSKGIAGC